MFVTNSTPRSGVQYALLPKDPYETRKARFRLLADAPITVVVGVVPTNGSNGVSINVPLKVQNLRDKPWSTELSHFFISPSDISAFLVSFPLKDLSTTNQTCCVKKQSFLNTVVLGQGSCVHGIFVSSDFVH